jgi:hypothetical protein
LSPAVAQLTLRSAAGYVKPWARGYAYSVGLRVRA